LEDPRGGRASPVPRPLGHVPSPARAIRMPAAELEDLQARDDHRGVGKDDAHGHADSGKWTPPPPPLLLLGMLMAAMVTRSPTAAVAGHADGSNGHPQPHRLKFAGIFFLGMMSGLALGIAVMAWFKTGRERQGRERHYTKGDIKGVNVKGENDTAAQAARVQPRVMHVYTWLMPHAAVHRMPLTDVVQRVPLIDAAQTGGVYPGRSYEPEVAIAGPGAAAELQEPWVQCWSEEYHVPWFWNPATQESVWQRPLPLPQIAVEQSSKIAHTCVRPEQIRERDRRRGCILCVSQPPREGERLYITPCGEFYHASEYCTGLRRSIHPARSCFACTCATRQEVVD